jgi:hypothetical protein
MNANCESANAPREESPGRMLEQLRRIYQQAAIMPNGHVV